MKPSILCSIATRGRYFTTLPLTLSAVINQTRLPDKVVIFDDNDEPADVRECLAYSYFFKIMEEKGVEWEWIFAAKKGQHYSHQFANTMGYDWVWRVDDDCIPEATVLEKLSDHIDYDVGAIGGSILTPPLFDKIPEVTGNIDLINNEPNIQWSYISEVKEVMHLHCSFLYRAGVYDYHLGLSRVAHREETLFTYGLYSKGYKILVVPDAESWHMRNPEGGIRSETKKEMYEHDERIFRNLLKYRDYTIVVLDSGMGDHIVFSHVLPDIKNPLVFTCYPDIVPGRSLAEAKELFGELEHLNIYRKMKEWNWTESLESAYRKLYL